MKKYLSIAAFLTLVLIATKILDQEDTEGDEKKHQAYFLADYQMKEVTSTFYNHSGDKVYQIKAQEIDHVTATETTNFHSLTMEIDRGDINIDAISDFATAPSKSTLYFPHRVDMISENTQLKEIAELQTSNLTVDTDRQLITSPESVALETSSLSSVNRLSGKGLIVDLKNESTKILEDVSSQIIIKPKKEHE